MNEYTFIYSGTLENERILTITQIYHLEILEKNISIPVLIRAVNLLPNIITLKIHSLSTNETTELTVKELYILFSMKEKSKITKVHLEEIGDDRQLDFIFTICPYMEYFKVGCTNTMDIQTFLRTIFKKMNHHLRSLCLHLPTANDQIVQNIEQMIKREKIFPHFTVKRIMDTIDLQWK